MNSILKRLVGECVAQIGEDSLCWKGCVVGPSTLLYPVSLLIGWSIILLGNRLPVLNRVRCRTHPENLLGLQRAQRVYLRGASQGGNVQTFDKQRGRWSGVVRFTNALAFGSQAGTLSTSQERKQTIRDKESNWQIRTGLKVFIGAMACQGCRQYFKGRYCKTFVFLHGSR